MVQRENYAIPKDIKQKGHRPPGYLDKTNETRQDGKYVLSLHKEKPILNMLKTYFDFLQLQEHHELHSVTVLLLD
jgi:hypothetical protein